MFLKHLFFCFLNRSDAFHQRTESIFF
jgi:hypothetical protein